MNRQQQNHRLRMDSCLSHWGRGGGGLNAPSSEILLLLKHNNYLAGMEKTDCFCHRYPDSSLSEKKAFSIRIKFVLIIHATIAK